MTSTGWAPHEVAKFDQFTSAADSVSAYGAVLRDKLQAHGFTRDEAIGIVADWLLIVMNRAIE